MISAVVPFNIHDELTSFIPQEGLKAGLNAISKSRQIVGRVALQVMDKPAVGNEGSAAKIAASVVKIDQQPILKETTRVKSEEGVRDPSSQKVDKAPSFLRDCFEGSMEDRMLLKRRRSPDSSEEDAAVDSLEKGKTEAQESSVVPRPSKRLKAAKDMSEAVLAHPVFDEPVLKDDEVVTSPPSAKWVKLGDELEAPVIAPKQGLTLAECRGELEKVVKSVCLKVSPFLGFVQKAGFKAYCSLRLPMHIKNANSYKALAELAEWYRDYLNNPANTKNVNPAVVKEVVAVVHELIEKMRSMIVS